MLKFSIRESSSETDLRGGEISDTFSYNSQQKDTYHSCRECDKRRRALSKERNRTSRTNSRSRERLNYNNNRCNHDNSLTSSETTNYDLSDGQDSMTCTTSTSNSEMSSSITSNSSFYKRFTLRSKSKDASQKGKRSESPESSTRAKISNNVSERRGRRGLWELQKAATRVIGPDSRVGRWVGKLRSRSSEARVGSLKSRYSEIQNWDGWKLEDRESMESNSTNVNPKLMVNDRPVSPADRPVYYGKKIIRSRSTEAISWACRQDKCRDLVRESPVRKSFEKAINNKMGLSQEAYSVPRTKLHSRFESEPNLTRRHLYDELRNERRPHIADVGDDTCARDTRRHDVSRSSCNLQTNQRHERRSRSTQSRQSRRSSIERVSDSKRQDSERLGYDSRYYESSPRHHVYQKNQRLVQNTTVPSRNAKKPPSGRRPPQSYDSQNDIRTHSRENTKYEKKYNARDDNFRDNKNRRMYHDKDGSRHVKSEHLSPDDSEMPYYNRNTSYANHRDRTLDKNATQKPVRAQYTPPKLAQNKAYVKRCSVEPSPRDSASKVPSRTAVRPPHNLSTKVSTSCTALHEINSSNNLKRYHSEQQLKRTSLASVVSIESLDSGTSCSDDRSSPNSSEQENENTSTMSTCQKSDDQSNISARSSDSGYRSPVSVGPSKKDWKDVETLILSSCFGEETKVAKKPVVNTSDYESESGFEDKLMTADAARVQFLHASPKLKPKRSQEGGDDHSAHRQQRSPFRRSPKKTRQTGHTSRSSDSKTNSDNLDLSNLTTKVRARLNHKAMSTAEMSVRRGDILYLKRASLMDDVFWVRAYSSITGDVGLIPTVVLCSRMEDLV